MYTRLCSVIAVLFFSVSMLQAENVAKTGATKTDAEKTAAVKSEFHENLHYKRVPVAQPTQSAKDRIEVVEMFFYACPHCNKLDPTLDEWVKTKAQDVDFMRVPAIIGPTWAIQAKAFYVAEALGLGDDIRKKLFKSIHEDGKQYYNEYSMMTFFTEQGVDRDRFIKLYESEDVVEKSSMAREKTVRYGIRGVPAIIVNGKYFTATYFTRDHKELMDVVDFLIDKERKDLLASAQSPVNKASK